MVGQGGCFTLSFVIFDIFLTRIWQYPGILPYHQSPLEVAKKFYQAFNPKIQQELSRIVLRLSTCYQPSSGPSQNLSFPGKWWDMPPAWFFMWTSTMKCQHQGGNHGGWFPYQCSMLHVWNIYQHLSSHWPKCREPFHTWRVFANVLEDKKTALLLQRHPAPSPPPICFFWQRIYCCSCVNCLGNCERSLEPNPGDCFEIEQRNTRKDIIILSIKHDFKSPKLGAWSLDPSFCTIPSSFEALKLGFLGPKKSKQIGKTNAPLPRSGAVLQAAGNGWSRLVLPMQGWILFFLFRTKKHANIHTYIYIIYMVYWRYIFYIYIWYIEDIYIYNYVWSLLLPIGSMYAIYIYIWCAMDPKMSMILRDSFQLGWSSGLSHVLTWFL